jgi:ribonuclease HII
MCADWELPCVTSHLAAWGCFKLGLGDFPHCATSEDWAKMSRFASVSPKPTSAPGKPLSASAAKLRLLKKLHCTLRFEKKMWQLGARLVAGVDEVGRGSLFGPVVAAAVILDPAYRVRGLRDSKLLPAERREILAERIRERAVAWAIAAVDAARIDQINIYQASRLAMREAVLGLDPGADHLLVDAMRLDCDLPQQPIIHGDALSASIAAASILAKVERDRMIVEWDPVFPAYGLASNKGYSTPRHLSALREHGPSPLHRQSFAPVWSAPVPQDVLAFMLEEDEGFDSAILQPA